jgi:formylglycine-generating enzyme required for sulfatase activity
VAGTSSVVAACTQRCAGAMTACPSVRGSWASGSVAELLAGLLSTVLTTVGAQGSVLVDPLFKEITEAFKLSDSNNKQWQESIKSEAPQHKVILTQPIYLGVDEVTQAEYEKVAGNNPSYFSATGEGKVYISDAKGNVVASFPGTGWLVSWSPDSTRVVTSVDQGHTFAIYGLDGVRHRLRNRGEMGRAI